MGSQWLQGSIRHRRLYPVRHEFEYHTGMLALDTDEWHQVAKVSPFFSLERFNWMSLKRKDYFRPEAGDLSEAVREQVEAATGWRPDGPVELITHPVMPATCSIRSAFTSVTATVKAVPVVTYRP